MTSRIYVDAAGNCLGIFSGMEPPAGAIEVPIMPSHGSDRWDGTKWLSRAEVPHSIAMWAARAVLIEEGVLEMVRQALDAIPDQIAREKALAKFEYSSTVRRDDALVRDLIPKLGMTEYRIDQMFIRAKAMED